MKDEITFGQLSIWLKLAVCLAWIIGTYVLLFLALGFVIGVMNSVT